MFIIRAIIAITMLPFTILAGLFGTSTEKEQDEDTHNDGDGK